MSDYFLLDLDYKDFPEKQPLKFLTVYGEQHSRIAMAFFVIIVAGFIALLFLFSALPREWAYFTNSSHSTGVVTESCHQSHRWYTYSFEAYDMQGNLNHYTGEKDQHKNDPCPKIGDTLPVEYLADQPEQSARVSSGTYDYINVCGIGFFVIFALYSIYTSLRDISFFLKVRPKYNLLKTSTTILDGIIFSMRDTTNSNVRGRTKGHYVEVEYEFLLNQQIYRGQQIKRRDDLKGKPLPQPGTPVYVLYADESTYVML